MSSYAIIYIRSAVTTAQVGPKMESCRNWAAQRGYTVAAAFVEFASGLDPHLPILDQALDRTHRAKASLVCFSGANIARSSELFRKRILHWRKLRVNVLFVLP